MKNHYLSLILLPFVPLAAMEQGALLVQKPVLKTAPSLKELALKAYAKILRENAPEKTLSEKELVGWGEDVGLQNFFDLDLGDSLNRLKQHFEPRIIKTSGNCPNIFSPDGCYGMHDDFHNKKQYITHHDESFFLHSAVSTDQLVQFECGGCFHGRWPIFSPNAQWLLGWEQEGSALTLLQRSKSNNNANEVPISRVMLGDQHKVDYTFFDNDMLLIRTAREIFASSIADFVKRGKESLEEVYQRTDDLEYPLPISYKTVYALSDSYVACVGPIKQTIETLKCGPDGLFFLTQVLVIPGVMEMIVVHPARAIAAICTYNTKWCRNICLCNLRDDDVGEKSTINVESLENYVFSPNGDYLACGTTRERQVIEIFDCKNPASPQRIQVISQVVEVGPAQCRIWTDQMLIVSDGGNKRHHITFNNRAALLVARYATYREKQEKKSNI